MKKFKHFFIFSCFLLVSHGAIWKTEDAYIIDDLPEDDDVETTTTTSSEGSCVSSSGSQGKCVPVEECSPLYDFFTNPKSNQEITEGLERYLDFDPCTSQSSNANGTRKYVCCTSLQYNSNVKSIDFEEYLSRFPESNETVPEIPLAQAVVPSPTEFQIVHGKPSQPGEFKYAVAILLNGRQICGGSLLSSKFVMSAAHCFDQFSPAKVRQLVLKVGDYDLSTHGESQHQDAVVSKLFLHPGFFRQKGFFRDDVALIKLKTPVSPSSSISTVALHTGSPDINSHPVHATVCGWGKTCGGSCSQSSVLKKTKIAIVSQSECSQRYQGTAAPPITQNMVCAGGNGGDACNGDSGGPLVIYSGGQTYQVGIVSWGIGCGQYPGVYTRVSSFGRWIAKHMQRA